MPQILDGNRVRDQIMSELKPRVAALAARVRPGEILLSLSTRGTVDLELWDVMREASFFRQVFRRRLRVEVV